MPCTWGLCLGSFICSQHLPVKALSSSFAQTPHSLASLLRFLYLQQFVPHPHAPQIPLLLHFYGLFLFKVINLGAFPLWASKEAHTKAVKATALHSDSPGMSLCDLGHFMWPLWGHANLLLHQLSHREAPVAQMVKNPPAMWETWVWSLGWEDPVEKGNATHSSILAWRIPWTV